MAGTILRVPELPDLAILADAFDACLTGRPIIAVRVAEALVMRATPEQVGSLTGEVLQGVERRGKLLVFRLTTRDIWAAPMLTGRFGLATPGAPRPKAAVTFVLGSRSAPPRTPAAWLAGAPWMPPGDREVELRYLDPTRMGKVYLVPAGDARGVPGAADLGPDADDPTLTLDAWQARIRRHPGELKSLLRNQAFVAGIGNAYSDEILWEARLSPFRRRATLAPEETADPVRGDPGDPVRGRGRAAGARAPDVREAGPGSPAGAPAGRPAMRPLRGDDQPGGRPRGHVLLPQLPALSEHDAVRRRSATRAQGSFRTWPTRMSDGLVMLLRAASFLTVVPNLAAIAPRVSPGWIL